MVGGLLKRSMSEFYMYTKGIYPGKMELQTNNLIRIVERKKENWAPAQSIYLFI